ncbi:MAG: tetratricopeptide repeat protein [Bacteroidales bacterium]
MTKAKIKKTPSLAVSKPDFWKNKYLSFLFVILIIILYGNTFHHAFVLDDDIVYQKNSFVLKGINGIGDIFSYGYLYGFNKENDQSYRPLTLASFAVENQFFNKSSTASHVIQVLLYALACFVLLKLLLEIFTSTPLLAYLIAMLFASHPIHTEVVANIKSRDEILSFLFIILTLKYLLKYLNTKNIYKLIFSAISFILAILSKESALPLIAVIPFFIYIFSNKSLKINISITAIFISISIFYLLLRASILSSMGFAENMDIINNTLGATSNKADELATIFYILGNYIKLLILPYPLSFDYSYNHFSIVSWTNIISIFSLLTYLFIGVFAIIRMLKKQADGFGLLFFLIMFSISTNIFVKIGATLGERFLFTPSFGFILAITFLLWQKFCKSKVNTKLVITLFSIVFIFSVITFQRNKDWKSNFTLFESAINVSPNSARVQSSMASEYRIMAEKSTSYNEKSINYEKAIFHYQKAAEIYPKFTDAYYNLGVCYQFWGKNDLAKDAYVNALNITPNHINSLNNLGVIYFNNQQMDSALCYFNSSNTIDSLNSNTLGNIGGVYHTKGNYIEAIKYYEKSLACDKSNKNSLGNILKACKAVNDTIRLKKYENWN